MNALDRAMAGLLREVSGKAILPHYRRLEATEIESKAPGDVVTVADRTAEAMLIDGLARIEPSLTIVGEEGAHADPQLLEALTGSCWIVDPLDGTNNFAAGRPPFGIIVARTERGVAQSGWLYDCLTGRFCAAHAGSGAFIDRERVNARGTGELPAVAAVSLVFASAKRREQLRRHIAPHYRLVDIPRCAAEQYPRLALGQNDVSIFERTLPWDHAAGVLWLNEAGGMAARPDGEAYCVDDWDRPGLIGAASPALWHELAARYAVLD